MFYNLLKIKLFLFLFFINFNMQSQSSKTLEVLQEKQLYFELTDALQKKYATKYLSTNTNPIKPLSKIIAFEYSFATIELIQSIDILSIIPNNNSEIWLSIRISKEFNIFEVVCKNQNYQQEIEKFAKEFISNKNKNSTKNSIKNDWLLLCQKSEENIRTADNIAKISNLCSAGDNYSPSFYSKILITENGMALFQDNFYNAKSMNKSNYTIRKLLFLIPFPRKDNVILKNEYGFEYEDNYKYKDMSIYFSDTSSPSNKECGIKIKNTIKKLFE